MQHFLQIHTTDLEGVIHGAVSSLPHPPLAVVMAGSKYHGQMKDSLPKPYH